MAAAQSLNYCLYCKKSHQLQLKKHNFHIDVLSCRQFYPTEIAFINKTKDNSKQSHDTTAILFSLWFALRLDQPFSTLYKKLNIWLFYEVSIVRLWWTSENHVSRYLFLEQIAHFLEGFLTFLSKAGDLMQRFSESTHIGVLNKACKMMKVRKKLKSFSSTDGLYLMMQILVSEVFKNSIQ